MTEPCEAEREAEFEPEFEAESEPETSRTLRQYWPYLLLAVVLLLIPGLLGNTPVAVPVALACIVFGPLAVGYLDARQFRFTWSFIIIAGFVFMVSKGLYYQDSAWIYLVPVVVLAWLGLKLGERTVKENLGA